MKTLKNLTILVAVLVQTAIFAQAKKTTTIATKQKTIQKKESKTIKISDENLKKFIGKYLMEEANFKMEIVKENSKMYVITEFSKDILSTINETTLKEFKRNVSFKLVDGKEDALQFSQNGYITTLTKIKPTTKK